MVARSAVAVIDVPVDARRVRRRVVGERRRATITFNSVLRERRQVGALGHAFRAGETTDEVVIVVAIVLRQLYAVSSINQCVYFRLKTHRTETVGDRLRDRQT